VNLTYSAEYFAVAKYETMTRETPLLPEDSVLMKISASRGDLHEVKVVQLPESLLGVIRIVPPLRDRLAKPKGSGFGGCERE
jgi:hypothetical protein